MNESSRVVAATRKSYAAPSLVLYGSIAKLTLGTGGSRADGGANPNCTKPTGNNYCP